MCKGACDWRLWRGFRPGLRKHDWARRDDTSSFLKCNELIRLNIRERIFLPAGPHDGEADFPAFFRLAQPEGERQFALRQIARTGLHHAKQPGALARRSPYLGADAVAIGARADGLHAQHVVLVAVVVAQQSRRAIVGGDHQIQVAVVVEIGVGRAPADDRPGSDAGPNLARHFFELALAQVAEKKRRLGIFRSSAAPR